MNKFIPLSVPNFEGNEKKYVDDAIEQCWVSTGGAYVTRLEKDLAEYLKTDNVAVCQSGTSALHLSLTEAEVGFEDVVIVPALTFIAAVNPVIYQSAQPVFMDCDDSLCIDPVKLKMFCEEKCIFDGEHLLFNGSVVKAMIVVHVFGNMADMEAIMNIAEKYNIIVIEDATEALGTYYTSGKFAGKYAGTIGHFGAYSFNGNKIITTGGGGAVTANNSGAVEHMRYLSTQAKDDPVYYIHYEVGYNYRMTNLQAALGVAQLEMLEKFIERKNKNYFYYKNLLNGYKDCKILGFRENVRSNTWFYSFMLSENSIARDEFIKKLNDRKIQTRPVWGLINEQKPYEKYFGYKIEKAVYYNKFIVNLPCSTNLSKEDVEMVVKEIKEIL